MPQIDPNVPRTEKNGSIIMIVFQTPVITEFIRNINPIAKKIKAKEIK